MYEAREFTKRKRFSFMSWWQYSAADSDRRALRIGGQKKEYSKPNRLVAAGLVTECFQASGTYSA